MKFSGKFCTVMALSGLFCYQKTSVQEDLNCFQLCHARTYTPDKERMLLMEYTGLGLCQRSQHFRYDICVWSCTRNDTIQSLISLRLYVVSKLKSPSSGQASKQASM